jgi:histidine phosphotransfer protein HptB
VSISYQAIDKMREIIGGDRDVLAEILESFIDEAGPLAEAVRNAARDGKLDMLGRTAHTIKSSARDFGDDELAALCAAVELSSKAGALPNALANSERIAQGCLALKEELAAYIGKELKGEAA